MEHGLTLITTLTAAFGFAMLFGFIAERLKVPSLVGYLLSGIIISPSTPGFVADVNLATQLSEIGVMLLMFGVGLHFSLADILRVKYVAVIGAVGQMAASTIVTMVISHLWGYSWGEALVFGVCLSCASTVVLLKALEAKGVIANFGWADHCWMACRRRLNDRFNSRSASSAFVNANWAFCPNWQYRFFVVHHTDDVSEGTCFHCAHAGHWEARTSMGALASGKTRF